jgi:hypothetical protein
VRASELTTAGGSAGRVGGGDVDRQGGCGWSQGVGARRKRGWEGRGATAPSIGLPEGRNGTDSAAPDPAMMPRGRKILLIVPAVPRRTGCQQPPGCTRSPCSPAGRDVRRPLARRNSDKPPLRHAASVPRTAVRPGPRCCPPLKRCFPPPRMRDVGMLQKEGQPLFRDPGARSGAEKTGFRRQTRPSGRAGTTPRSRSHLQPVRTERSTRRVAGRGARRSCPKEK